MIVIVNKHRQTPLASMLFVTPAMPIGLRGLERNLLNPHLYASI